MFNVRIVKNNKLSTDHHKNRVPKQHQVISGYNIAIVIPSKNSLVSPLHIGCDHCASLVRPQKWPGRLRRQDGGRTVASVVQGWYTRRSVIAKDAIVATKFWAYSKQSHKVAEEVGRSQVAQWRQGGGIHIAVVAERMHSDRPLVAP